MMLESLWCAEVVEMEMNVPTPPGQPDVVCMVAKVTTEDKPTTKPRATEQPADLAPCPGVP
jgi:hypothetical protein